MKAQAIMTPVKPMGVSASTPSHRERSVRPDGEADWSVRQVWVFPFKTRGKR